MTEHRRPIGIDLFCGAGGMSLGFEQAGFDVVAAVESEAVHIEAHKINFPDCKTIPADVSTITGEEIRKQAGIGRKKIDVLFGGPPCNGFSLIGRRRMDDPRNSLLRHFARLVGELRPSYFVVENVQGMLLGNAKATVDSFEKTVRSIGYLVVKPIEILDAQEFGVPQRRKRVFILGYEKGRIAPQYPLPIFGTDGNGVYSRPTVWDAVGDLAVVTNRICSLDKGIFRGDLGKPSHYAQILRGELRDPDDRSKDRAMFDGLTGCAVSVHSSDTIKRFVATESGMYEPKSRLYRLSKGGVAPTLRAGSDHLHGSYTAARPIHPCDPSLHYRP